MDILSSFIEFKDIVTNATAGIIVVAIIFFYKEKISPITNMSGQWFIKSTTLDSAYNPYKEMVLIHQVLILQNGTQLEGTLEKIYEKSQDNRHINYIGADRIRSNFSGYIERNYFGADRIYIHAIENGKKREVSTFFEVKSSCNHLFLGKFISTAGDSKGTCEWQKKSFI